MNLEEMFGKQEPLLDELRPYIEDCASGLQVLKHPLITQIYHEQMNGFFNRSLRARQSLLANVESEGRWEEALWMHERPWRLHAFAQYRNRLPETVAADLLTEVWKDCESPAINRETWIELFREYAPLSAIMKRSLGHLPNKPFEIYRGMCQAEERCKIYGLAWTLDRPMAEWFATRFGDDGVVKTAVIDPKHVFAYLPERSESEVVVDPEVIE